MTTAYKTGRFTLKECDYIKMHCDKLTPQEISTKLNRNPDSIRGYIQRNGLNIRGTEEHKEYAEHSLITGEHWNAIKLRYTDAEQTMFTQHYKELVGQFQNEVPYTELFQIIDYIHIEIEIQRTAVSKKQIVDSITRLQGDLERLRKKSDDDEKILMCEDLILAKESSINQMNKDLISLLDKKERYAKSMKGTREQRVQRIESAKKTFNAFIADLVANPEKMRSVGITIEKHRLATDVAYEALHDYHTYADGENDPPILNADSVKKLNKEQIDKYNLRLTPAEDDIKEESIKEEQDGTQE